jgi:SAM-dependent methyltransferase
MIISEKLPPAQMLFLQEAVAAASALASSDRLGVLARLDKGPVSPDVLAHDCGIGKHGAHLLLSALSGLGIVEAGEDGSYRSVVPNLSRQAGLLSPWAQLDEVLRHEQPIIDAGSVEGADEFYPDIVPYMGSMLSMVAGRAADYLFHPGLRILDVGAGAAPWSLALAKRDPACRVTAVDLPGVLPTTRQAVIAAGCDGQYDYLEGDIFSLELARSAYNLIVLGNICHLFAEEADKQLLGRLCETLAPKGKLAILDLLPNERRDGPRWIVLYALGLLLRTRHGQAYPFSAYARWLGDAGYEAVQRFELVPGTPISLITAQRT